MSAPWLAVVGIGADGLASLSGAARAVVEAGEVLVGGDRHLAMVPGHQGPRLTWGRPLAATLDRLATHRGRRVVVLASGDPMCFGVGELLARRFGPSQLRVLPAPSAFSLVCARLGWSRQAVETLSLHARPAAILHRHLLPGARLVVLCHDGTTPEQIARTLVERGFGPSAMWAFENLGAADEQTITGRAETWATPRCADLTTVAVDCRPGPAPAVHPLVPGLPDDAFDSDGLLTKREVRAITVARLAPLPGQRLWDVGAGSGAVAIEWLRAAPRSEALAIERDPMRCARIDANGERLGTPELQTVQGDAPGCLDDLPAPDAVFVGGGLEQPGLLARCWRALAPGGRLVANAVTLEGERALSEWHVARGGELTRIEIARAAPLGRHHAWRPALPVTQLAAVKP